MDPEKLNFLRNWSLLFVSKWIFFSFLNRFSLLRLFFILILINIDYVLSYNCETTIAVFDCNQINLWNMYQSCFLLFGNIWIHKTYERIHFDEWFWVPYFTCYKFVLTTHPKIRWKHNLKEQEIHHSINEWIKIMEHFVGKHLLEKLVPWRKVIHFWTVNDWLPMTSVKNNLTHFFWQCTSEG